MRHVVRCASVGGGGAFPAQARTLQWCCVALLAPAAESDAALSVLQTTALVLETGTWGCVVVESAQTLLEHAMRTTHAKASFGLWPPPPQVLLFTHVACMVA